MTPSVVLVGPPGAGKTTVGRLVAAELGTPFVDTDEMVAERAGMAVADVFLRHGEPRFRELERDAVADALARHEGVVAVGGGAVLDDATRRLLAPLRVVQLTVGIADAARRVGFNRDRPLLLGNPRAQWTRLLEQRRPYYDEVAGTAVATDGRDADDVAADVVAWVRAQAGAT